MDLEVIALEDEYTVPRGRIDQTGPQARLRLPLLQERDCATGLDTAGFIAGYRGSPVDGSAEVRWEARRFLDQHHVVFRPAVHDEPAVTAARGCARPSTYARRGAFCAGPRSPPLAELTRAGPSVASSPTTKGGWTRSPPPSPPAKPGVAVPQRANARRRLRAACRFVAALGARAALIRDG